MKRIVGKITAAAIVGALAIGAAAPVRAQDAAGVESHPWIGEKAPRFELKQVAGDTLSLSGLEGKFVVIHFGASW